MAHKNKVYALAPGDAVGCFFCMRGDFGYERMGATFRRGEAFLAGPGHSPCNAEANYVCRDHLDADAVIVDHYPPQNIALHGQGEG